MQTTFPVNDKVIFMYTMFVPVVLTGIASILKGITSTLHVENAFVP